jgi:cytochrome P450
VRQVLYWLGKGENRVDDSWATLPVIDLQSPEWWQQPATTVRHLVEAGHRAAYVPGMDAPMLLRYHDIRHVVTMPQIGALGMGTLELAGWTAGPFVDAFRKWLVTLDPPDHDRLRRLVAQPFTPRQVDAMRASAQKTADALAADMANDGGSTDLYEAFAEPLPLTVLCDVLGVPHVDHLAMAGWMQPMSDALGNPTPDLRAAADAAMEQFSAYVAGLIEDHRRHRGDDLLGKLIDAEESGDRLSNEELVATTAQLLFAGTETTRDLIGAAVFTLLCHPEQLARFRRDPSLVANTVEEVLRYEPPITLLSRPVLEGEITVGGVTAHAGQRLLMDVASANRDPEVMERGEVFDVGRPSPSHLSFSWGAHFCLGASIARMEAAVALNTLLLGSPQLELDGPLPAWKPYTALRSLDSLHVRLGAR